MAVVTSFPIETTQVGPIRYDAPQILAASQQKQARENIEAQREIVVDVRDYGAVGDGVSDDTAAFIAAIATGKVVYAPKPSAFYRVTDTLSPQNNQLVYGAGHGTIIELDTVSVKPLFALFSKTDVKIKGFTLRASVSVPSGFFIDMLNAASCRLSDILFTGMTNDGTGAVVMRGGAHHNLVEFCQFTDITGTGVGIVGTIPISVLNEVRSCEFVDCSGFGIRIGPGGHSNLLVNCTTRSNGLELVGITWGATHNRVIGCHAEGTGDNGISLSGDYNTDVGNICINNQRAGIWCWGSFNTVADNVIKNSDQEGTAFFGGVGVHAMHGGAGSHNVFTGNTFDDDQAVPTQVPIVFAGNGYTDWATGVSITSGAFRTYGANIYVAASSGTTGATPPTHTTGTVSDDVVSWTYRNSRVGSAFAGHNVVGPNTYGRKLGSENVTDTSGAFATNTRVDGQRLRMAGGGVVGGGEPATWTSLNTWTVKGTGNVGIALQSGDGGLSAISFGSIGGGLGGRVQYDDITNYLSLFAGGISQFTVSTSLAISNQPLLAPHVQLTDGITDPDATPGLAKIYVDTADGDLKIIFGDGIIKTIVVDT